MDKSIQYLRNIFIDETGEDVIFNLKPEPFFSDSYVYWLESFIIGNRNFIDMKNNVVLGYKDDVIENALKTNNKN